MIALAALQLRDEGQLTDDGVVKPLGAGAVFTFGSTLVPQPIVRKAPQRTKYGALYFGSTAPAMSESIEAALGFTTQNFGR